MTSSALSVALGAVASPAARVRSVRRASSIRPLRAAASAAAPATRVGGNPMAGVELFDVDGNAKTVPFWSEDQTVVVTFLRHFG